MPAKGQIQPSLLTEEVLNVFLRVIGQGGTVAESCRQANISRGTYERWMKVPDPGGLLEKFQDEVKAVLLEAKSADGLTLISDLENSVYDAATKTRYRTKIRHQRLYRLTATQAEALQAMGGEDMVGRFQEDIESEEMVVILEERFLEEVLPDGVLADKAARRHQQEEQRRQAEIEKTRPRQRRVIGKLHEDTPSVE